MTHNRRYEAQIDALSAARIAAQRPGPVTLPSQAYGPQKLEWAPRGQGPPVWVWIQWRDAPAERIAAQAAGWNDRVVVVEWWAPGGTRNTVVWRQAVTVRTTEDAPRSSR